MKTRTTFSYLGSIYELSGKYADYGDVMYDISCNARQRLYDATSALADDAVATAVVDVEAACELYAVRAKLISQLYDDKAMKLIEADEQYDPAWNNKTSWLGNSAVNINKTVGTMCTLMGEYNADCPRNNAAQTLLGRDTVLRSDMKYTAFLLDWGRTDELKNALMEERLRLDSGIPKGWF